MKKGNDWKFGYIAHVGVDSESGLVHSVEVTAANVHDVTMTPELLTGEDEVVYGDSGYIGAEKRDNAITHNKQGKKIKYRTNRKPSQIKRLSKSGQYKAKKKEHQKSSVRAKVEHVFAVIKNLFGCRKNTISWQTKTDRNIEYAVCSDKPLIELTGVWVWLTDVLVCQPDRGSS